MSSVLLAGRPVREHPGPSSAGPPPPTVAPPSVPLGQGGPERSNTLTVIAGVGVLLLAMGVGVLIGRSGATSKSSPAPPQVVTVAAGPAASAPGAAAEPSFTDDWPAGTSGYTVELRKLTQAGTTVSAVEAAKAAASAKGATAVGALKSEDFSSLAAGSYLIYSGVYHNKAEAEKALGGLKKSFPAASVIHVSNASSGASSSPASSSSGGGAGSSESHPAPPSVLKNLNTVKGKSYEEKSKNLPDVVETG
jgi:hypothetical protein